MIVFVVAQMGPADVLQPVLAAVGDNSKDPRIEATAHLGEVLVRLDERELQYVFKDRITDDQLVDLIRKHFRLTPKGIIETLNLRKPIYKETARNGHFGRELPGFTWEKTDKADVLRKETGKPAMAHA